MRVNIRTFAVDFTMKRLLVLVDSAKRSVKCENSGVFLFSWGNKNMSKRSRQT